MRLSLFLGACLVAAWASQRATFAGDTFSVSDAVAVDVHEASFGGDSQEFDDESCCDDSEECSCFLFGPDEAVTLFSGENCHGISAGGWTQIGYHTNQTPLSVARNDALAFNDHADRLNLHQQWLWLEKALSGNECCWDWGFRMDIMYGTDAAKTQSFGGTGWDAAPEWDRGGGYGWAMPQLYGELGYGDFSVKFGHFYTLVGYEVVTAPDNFFYSHALTMFNSEPFTHTGAIVTYGASDSMEVYAGWTAGWDTGFESVNGGSSFLGGFGYTVSDNLSVTYIATAGNFGAIGTDAYSHSVVADLSLTDKLNYVLQSDYKRVDSTGDDDVGINQYLLYSLSDCLGVGARLEWWKDDGNSHNAVTAGINYRPHANLVFRPEIRHDWDPVAFDQTTFGMDAILVY
jgi:hypothetical protein